MLATDKARALLAVGLGSDAMAELDSAMASFRRQRLDYDLAEAELARSEAALAAGELAGARRWAAAASGTSGARATTRGPIWPSSPGSGPGSPRRAAARPLAAQALLLAERLRGCGLASDADMAELLAARALLASGRPDEARRRIAVVRRRGATAPLDVSLLRRLARAELAELEGPAGGGADRTPGRAGDGAGPPRPPGQRRPADRAGALGSDLAAAGLRLALVRRSRALVFAWLERSRAQAFRVRPVRPPADPQQPRAGRAAPAQLPDPRGRTERQPRSGGDPSRAELQREIREHEWQAGGLGEAIGAGRPGRGRRGAGGSGQSLVGILAQHGQMRAVVLRPGSARLIRLGDFDAAAEAARRLNADLDTLAGRRLPARLETVIRESVRHQTQMLTAEMVDPLRSSGRR